MGQNATKIYILGALGGLQWSDRAYLALQLSSHPYLCTCEIRKQSDKIWQVQIQNMLFLFFIFGVSWGPLHRIQGYQIFRALRRWLNHSIPPKYIHTGDTITKVISHTRKSPQWRMWRLKAVVWAIESPVYKFVLGIQYECCVAVTYLIKWLGGHDKLLDFFT